MKNNNKNNKELFSAWKDIAAYLDCDVRTCQRWENKFGLPIHRFDDASNSSVFAYKEELDVWLKRRSNHESFYQKAAEKMNLWKKRFFFAVPIFLVSLFILSLILFRDVQPADFKIKGSVLVITNEGGKELWTFDTGITNICDEEYYRENFQKKRFDSKDGIISSTYFPLLIIQDLNADGKKEVLFSIQTEDETNEGEIFCFDDKGHQQFVFDSGRQLKYGDIIYSNDYRVDGLEIYDMNKDGVKEIILTASHRYDFPTVFYILDHNGSILGEYWNSGRITDFIFKDINQDNEEELIVVGMNNEYKKPSLFVFDSNNVSGCSPQLQEFFSCEEFEKGSEKYHLLFPKIKIPPGVFMEALTKIHSPEPNTLWTMTMYSIVEFDLDFNLEISSVRLSHTFELAYKKAYEDGFTEIPYDREFLAQKYASELLYWDGKEWTSEQVMSNPWEKSKN